MIRTTMNIKGGVGKTFTAQQLGYAFARAGKKTLLIDADGQGNLTQQILGKDLDDISTDKILTSVLKGEKNIRDCIWETPEENLYIVPSDLSLFETIYDLEKMSGREFKLSSAIKDINEEFDEIIIDNNPSINVMMVNSIIASDEIICVANTGAGSIKGVKVTLNYCQRTLSQLSFVFEKPLKIKVLISKVRKSKTDESIIQQMRDIFGDMLYKTTIRANDATVTKAEYDSKPIIDNKRAGVAVDFRKFVEEVMQESEGK